MKKILLVLLTIGLFSSTALYAESYKIEEKEKIQKTLKFKDPERSKELQVDSVFGSIKVEGYEGQTVSLTAYKTIKARTKEKIQKAQEEVQLDITEEGNTVDIYVDGPFRCRCDRGRWKPWRHPGYQVNYDFELKVPRRINLFLRTVNEGEIIVRNIEGEFIIKNVNGRIEMTEIAGGGTVHTVNGKVKVIFRKNPEADCSVHTINGNIEVSFPRNLSADFRLKTFNGDAFSDFPVTYLPQRAAVEGFDEGKYVYKSNHFVGIRVGKGGPEIKLDTLNGDILIAQRKQHFWRIK